MTRKMFLFRSSMSLSLFLLPLLSLKARTVGSNFPEIQSYARVSRNRGEVQSISGANSTDHRSISQSRAYQGISPIYVSNLRNGEAVDYKPSKTYSTLDHQAIAQLDAFDSSQLAQDRFHPPASFEHSLAHSNALKMGSGPAETAPSPKFPVPAYATLSKDVYYQSSSKTSDKAPSTPTSPSGDQDFSIDTEDSFAKIPDSYAQPEIYESEHELDGPDKFPSYPSLTSYGNKYPSIKPAYTSYLRPHYEDPHENHGDYHDELIYDHPPKDHYDDHTTTTTEEPEMNDERLSKRPYSYYYIGKKLWYIPLYFSIYFIIYIAALVLKSVARHKINFPANLAAAAADAGRGRQEAPGWLDLTKRVLDGIDLYNSIGKS